MKLLTPRPDVGPLVCPVCGRLPATVDARLGADARPVVAARCDAGHEFRPAAAEPGPDRDSLLHPDPVAEGRP